MYINIHISISILKNLELTEMVKLQIVSLSLKRLTFSKFFSESSELVPEHICEPRQE